MSLLDMQGLEATRGSEDADRGRDESMLSALACGPSCASTILCL
jgi:hypothetical protein